VTWRPYRSGAPGWHGGVHFVTETQGWACGQFGAILNSTDGGETWAAQQSGTDRNFRELFFIDELTGYAVAVVGTITKTTDGGQTWKNTLFVSDSTGAMDVDIMPGNPDVVYAWMSRIERKPWTIISGSEEGGFYKSTDGGETWKNIRNGLPGEIIGKANLEVTAAKPDRIYALIEAKPGGGFYRSDDSGESWQMINDMPAMIQRPFYYTTLGTDPSNADVVYGGAEGFWRSEDAGVTWTRLSTPHGDNHDIWVNPNDSHIMVQANDGGANVSYDYGATWSTQYNQPTIESYGVWTDERFPYRLYSAQQDDGTHILSSIAKGGTMGEDWWVGPGCETGPIIPHPLYDNIVYGSCKGQYSFMNLETGQSKNYWIGGQSLYGNEPPDLMLRFQRVSPMEVSPHDPEVLYYGSNKLHRTRDLGVTWETISPDLTWNPPHSQRGSGWPITRDVTGEEVYSTLYAIRESVLEPGVIWTGSNDGLFYITRDNGESWTNITPPDLPPGGRVQFLDPSPHRAGSAYYAVHRFLLGDYTPYFYRTDDYGQSWTLLTDGTNGIPKDWPVRVVREDPGREGLLYGGTEFGLFISFDNGAHWQPFQQNLPNVPMADLKVFRDDLILATQGRSLWILDNVSALHQVTEETADADVFLYTPRDGYRTRDGANILGPNIEYFLGAVPAGEVTIDILDASGSVVNSYSSGTGPTSTTRPDPNTPQAMMMEGRGGYRGRSMTPPARPTRAQGHNRFVWNVQHESGLGAPPGQYQARLTVGGTTLTTDFTVLIDPRLAEEGLTAADLQEQFRHNMTMRDMVAEVNALVERVEDAMEGATGNRAAQLQEIHHQLVTGPIRYSPPGLQTHIQYLAGMTARVDQKVGNQAPERYRFLRGELDEITAAVNRILGGS
jgi:photosystem II stability/assembly factor-like uncharacterized protein